MSGDLGLAPVDCPACGSRFFESVSRLKEVADAACRHCGHIIPVAEIEQRDPVLARLLTVLREQDRVRRR